MKPRLALIALTLAAAAAPASAAGPTAPVKLTIPGTGRVRDDHRLDRPARERPRRSRCRGRSPPAGQVTTCRQPQGASPSCVLFPGASYKDVFRQQPEPTVGPFACIPLGDWFKAKGAVCTVVSTGVGFRITPSKVTKVNQIPAGPHPPCTRAALSAGLARALHKRSLAPSYLTRGSRCAGNYAWGDYIDIHGPGTGDDITVVYRAKGRRWRPSSRAKVCIPANCPPRSTSPAP